MDQVQPPRTGGANDETIRDKHTRELGDEIARQTRDVTGQVRERLSGEAQSQSERLATTLRHLSEELEVMHKNAPGDSMAAAMVQRLGEGSRQVADYLRDHGPEGVLQEVQEYARRKPGTFLLTSAVAGFVVGRIGKGLLTSGSTNGSRNGSRNASGPGLSDERSATTYRSAAAAPQSPHTTGTAPVPTQVQPTSPTPDRDLP